jgi:hypothetical protein
VWQVKIKLQKVKDDSPQVKNKVAAEMDEETDGGKVIIFEGTISYRNTAEQSAVWFL